MVEEEPEGERDYNELENMIEEQEEHEPATQTQGSDHVDESEVESEFRLLNDRELDHLTLQCLKIHDLV